MFSGDSIVGLYQQLAENCVAKFSNGLQSDLFSLSRMQHRHFCRLAQLVERGLTHPTVDLLRKRIAAGIENPEKS